VLGCGHTVGVGRLGGDVGVGISRDVARSRANLRERDAVRMPLDDENLAFAAVFVQARSIYGRHCSRESALVAPSAGEKCAGDQLRSGPVGVVVIDVVDEPLLASNVRVFTPASSVRSAARWLGDGRRCRRASAVADHDEPGTWTTNLGFSSASHDRIRHEVRVSAGQVVGRSAKTAWVADAVE